MLVDTLLAAALISSVAQWHNYYNCEWHWKKSGGVCFFQSFSVILFMAMTEDGVCTVYPKLILWDDIDKNIEIKISHDQKVTRGDVLRYICNASWCLCLKVLWCQKFTDAYFSNENQ